MSDLVKILLGTLLVAAITLGGTGLLVDWIARTDCEARNTYSEYNYKYVSPFTCIYTGVK